MYVWKQIATLWPCFGDKVNKDVTLKVEVHTVCHITVTNKNIIIIAISLEINQ
jgi:hypothetical protein